MAALIKQFPEYKNLIGSLTHKKFHALIKKLKRKLRRRKLALVREKEEELKQLELLKCPKYKKKIAEEERENNIKLEFEEFNQKKNHEVWLHKEEIAKAEFRKKQEILRQKKLKQEEEERLIREEWEAKQEARKAEKENLVKPTSIPPTLLSGITTSLVKEGEEPWHNPMLGFKSSDEMSGTEKDKDNCPFYAKTGACRFGDRCSRHHSKPTSSRTILIPSMYSHFSIDQSLHDEYDSDISLEYEDKETFLHFKEFYDDVLPEFKAIGPLIQFKVCCNYEAHLRGNVYVQYESEADAISAYSAFNGRWYGGKQLSCQFTTVENWRSAICGLFGRKSCPKGKNCNFLHVFNNPNSFPGDNENYSNGQSEHRSNRSYSERSNYHSSSRSHHSNRSHEYSYSRSSSSMSHRSRKSDYSRSDHSSRREYNDKDRYHSKRSSKSKKRKSSKKHSKSPKKKHRSEKSRSRNYSSGSSNSDLSSSES